ncbi:MAG: hypothetical protein WC549_02045 [Actinomycetota bacterium]
MSKILKINPGLFSARKFCCYWNNSTKECVSANNGTGACTPDDCPLEDLSKLIKEETDKKLNEAIIEIINWSRDHSQAVFEHKIGAKYGIWVMHGLKEFTPEGWKKELLDWINKGMGEDKNEWIPPLQLIQKIQEM